jgi:hypothetical protein
MEPNRLHNYTVSHRPHSTNTAQCRPACWSRTSVPQNPKVHRRVYKTLPTLNQVSLVRIFAGQNTGHLSGQLVSQLSVWSEQEAGAVSTYCTGTFGSQEHVVTRPAIRYSEWRLALTWRYEGNTQYRMSGDDYTMSSFSREHYCDEIKGKETNWSRSKCRKH